VCVFVCLFVCLLLFCFLLFPPAVYGPHFTPCLVSVVMSVIATLSSYQVYVQLLNRPSAVCSYVVPSAVCSYVVPSAVCTNVMPSAHFSSWFTCLLSSKYFDCFRSGQYSEYEQHYFLVLAVHCFF
jgi:hypothetical protein